MFSLLLHFEVLLNRVSFGDPFGFHVDISTFRIRLKIAIGYDRRRGRLNRDEKRLYDRSLIWIAGLSNLPNSMLERSECDLDFSLAADELEREPRRWL